MKRNIYEGFKKVAEDDKTATMAHANGHKLQIVKKSLSPQLQKQLAALPLNQADPEAPVGETANDSSKQTESGHVTNIYVGGQPSQPPQIQKSDYALQAEAPQRENAQLKEAQDSIAQEQAKVDSDDRNFSDRGLQPPAELPQSLAPVAPRIPATSPAAAPPSQGMTPQNQAVNSAGMLGLPGYAEQAAGIQGEAAAQGQLGKEQAALYQNAAQQEQQNLQQTQQNMQEKWKEIQDITQDVKNGQIDPNHFLASKSTGQKIAYAIGMLFAGAGAGINHEVANPVMDYLNKQIENDLQAQKSNLGKKENLLSALNAQYGHMGVAENMFRATRANILADQINSAAAKSSDPMAKSRALMLNGQLKEKYFPIFQQANAMDMAQKMGSQPGGSLQKSAVLSRALVTPQMGATPAEIEQADKELNGVSQTMEKHKAADELMDQLAKQQTLGNRIMNPIQSRQAIAGVKAGFYPLIQSEDPSKRLTPEQMDKELDPFMQGLTTGKQTAQGLRTGVHRLIDTNAPGTATLQKFRVPVPQYQPPPVLRRTADGKTAAFDPTTKQFLGYR